MGFYESIETVGKIIDAAGVAAIAIGGVLAAGITIGDFSRRTPNTYKFVPGAARPRDPARAGITGGRGHHSDGGDHANPAERRGARRNRADQNVPELGSRA